MKKIIFDSSCLISLAMNCFFDELRRLKKKFKGKFIITKEVKYEIIDRALKIKKFSLEAMKLNELLEEGVLEMPSVDEKEISKKTDEVLNTANSIFTGRGSQIKLIDRGEASCIALAKILGEDKVVLGVDERTTRMLSEDQEGLRDIMQKRLHAKIEIKKNNYFQGIKFVRSAELAYIMFKKGLIKDKKVLGAALYALKFKGCSISEDEIRKIKKLA